MNKADEVCIRNGGGKAEGVSKHVRKKDNN
jgi:hypothetical protein